MFSTYFYHERVRRTVAAFGSLFNNIYILRKQANNNVVSQVRVPLAFAPKRKFLERIEEANKNEVSDAHIVAITLPRMSFEITGMNYDSSRQLPRTNSLSFPSTDTNRKTKIYTKTPYNIQFQLNLYARSHDDALQVVEQIMPYFTPSYTLTVKPLDEFPSIKDDVPITLQGISFSDDYEGSMETRRTIIYTLDFEMKIDVYGPTSSGAIIRQADISYFLSNDSDQSGWDLHSIYSVTTDPIDVSQDSDYTFVETLTIIGDGDSA